MASATALDPEPAMITILARPSIARRVFITLLAVFVVVWVVVYYQGYLSAERAGSGAFDRSLRDVAESLCSIIDAEPDAAAGRTALAGGMTLLRGVTESGQMPQGFYNVQVWSADGRLAQRSLHAPEKRLTSVGSGYFDASIGAERIRGYSAWTRDRSYRVDASQTLAVRARAFSDELISWDAIAPLLVAFPLVLLPLWFTVSASLRPLRRLSSELVARKSDDLEAVRSPLVYAELAPVVTALNTMLARIKELLRRERDFLADAAHELRTPLALITAQSDTLIHAQDVEARKEAAQRLSRGLARASRLVNQLLTLARLEASLPAPWSPVDVASLVRDSLAAHADLADAQAVELSYSGPDDLVVALPPGALESIVDNLVGNAIRYNRSGGHVEVTLAGSATSMLTLSVLDDGPGIAPGLRDRIFERFHRGSDASQSGSGLGLAIVASAARQLGATVTILDGEGNCGACFRVLWQPPANVA